MKERNLCPTAIIPHSLLSNFRRKESYQDTVWLTESHEKLNNQASGKAGNKGWESSRKSGWIFSSQGCQRMAQHSHLPSVSPFR